MKKKISFSPPDIRGNEYSYIKKVLRSGWITTGPMVQKYEKMVSEYLNAPCCVAVSSATAGMELILKLYGIGPGDEVITSPYTYAATANIIRHRNAAVVFADTAPGSFLIDLADLRKKITEKTRAIITIDIGGIPVDYDEVRKILKEEGREDIVFISDSAHAFGSRYKGKPVGTQADFHVFSFHAVKNLTTAEGGAITFSSETIHGMENITKTLKVTALHGQTKDAFAKMQLGAWKYDIVTDGYKCNMTDILAAFGIAQLERYDAMLGIRKRLFAAYTRKFSAVDWAITPFCKNDEGTESSYHLYLLRLKEFTEKERDFCIEAMAKENIATNVHFIPIPLFSYYQQAGYKIAEYPNAFAQYSNEISLPLYSLLSEKDAIHIADTLIGIVSTLKKL